MKSIVFDTGPLITLTLNHLMWILDPLKKRFKGKFYITEGVRYELIDRPLEINKFKFEALHSLHYLNKGTINIYPDKRYEALTNTLMDLINSIFSAHHKNIQIVHKGEIETLALANQIGAEAIAVDERTTIKLIEDPADIRRTLEKKLHTKIHVDRKRLNELKKYTNLKVIRSVGFAIAAYELGLLDHFLPEEHFDKGILLDAVLWGLKLNGCAISQKEIEELIKLEIK
ncbi:MAG: hypothetical protein R6V53_06640 [Candidatus Woesearchaeota archaeon]